MSDKYQRIGDTTDVPSSSHFSDGMFSINPKSKRVLAWSEAMDRLDAL